MVLRFQSSPSLSPYGKSLESSSVVVVVLLGLFSQLQCSVQRTFPQLRSHDMYYVLCLWLQAHLQVSDGVREMWASLLLFFTRRKLLIGLNQQTALPPSEWGFCCSGAALSARHIADSHKSAEAATELLGWQMIKEAKMREYIKMPPRSGIRNYAPTPTIGIIGCAFFGSESTIRNRESRRSINPPCFTSVAVLVVLGLTWMKIKWSLSFIHWDASIELQAGKYSRVCMYLLSTI